MTVKVKPSAPNQCHFEQQRFEPAFYLLFFIFQKIHNNVNVAQCYNFQLYRFVIQTLYGAEIRFTHDSVPFEISCELCCYKIICLYLFLLQIRITSLSL